MEPAPKRSRLGMVQSAFIFQCTTPKPDGTLWPPKLLELVVNGEKNEAGATGAQHMGHGCCF